MKTKYALPQQQGGECFHLSKYQHNKETEIKAKLNHMLPDKSKVTKTESM